jgi:hypothetical protein
MLDQPIQQQAGMVVQTLTPLVKEFDKHLASKY